MEQKYKTNNITHAVYVVNSWITHQDHVQAMGLLE
jgi:hypothetical protein